jgi:hypothetical protein
MPMTRHCRMTCISGCRRGIATFTGQEYMLLFTGGKRRSSRMEKTLRNIYAFNSAVVEFNDISHVKLINSTK